MSDESALIRAVVASPTDCLPRLAYADWLGDRADPRAEYLQLLCAAAEWVHSDIDLERVRERVRELEATIDPAWVVAMCRGVPAGSRGESSANGLDPVSEFRIYRPPARHTVDEVGVSQFLRQYARKAPRGGEPNDRSYSRKVEARLKRMKPEDVDRLMRGDED